MRKTILVWVTRDSSWNMASDPERIEIKIDQDLSFMHKGDQFELSSELRSRLISENPKHVKWIKSSEFKNWSLVIQALYYMESDVWIIALGEVLQETGPVYPPQCKRNRTTIEEEIEKIQDVLNSSEYSRLMSWYTYKDRFSFTIREYCKFTNSEPDEAIYFLMKYFPDTFDKKM